MLNNQTTRFNIAYFGRLVARLLPLPFVFFYLSCTHNPAVFSSNIKANDCAITAKLRSAPQYLLQTCLYSNSDELSISPQLVRFTPNFQLWSDGSNKHRWIYLPQQTKIDTSDPDRWVFPVGTQFFKEFRQIDKLSGKEIKVETRHFQKITPGNGIDSWLISTYLWNEQQTNARLSLGEENVLNTDHDIPSEQDCVDCHKGNIDIILGFDAIQLSDRQAKYAFGHGPKRGEGEWTLASLTAEKKLSHSIEQPVLPGKPLDQKVLGYLHANCGNCHNPLGHAADQEAEHLKFRHELSFDTLANTNVYRTAVNQKTKNFTAVPYIVLGAEKDELAIYQSALYLRMNSTDEDYRMPMIARKKTDYQGLSLIHEWLRTLPTPDEITFVKDHRQHKTAQSDNQVFAERSQPLSGPGLQIEVQFYQQSFVPPVMAIYWPEDTSLKSSPIMDHKDGYFTEKLILGNKGSLMSLRNSDDVGHTIYVKDKKQNVQWQLNYMPPNSKFKQELFWDNDVFVEMKCRLHLYMSSWVGSISTKFHKIITLEQASYKREQMLNYPNHYSELKIWLPRYPLISTNITIGQEQVFELKKGDKLQGKVRIRRNEK